MPALTSSTAIGITAAVIIAATGGTSLLAETAVPGDALYTVKTNVNESVRGSLAFSTSAEAEFNADLALRRLDEINALAEEDRLTSTVRAELQQEFEEHAEASVALAEKAGEEGDNKDAAEVMASFVLELGAQEEVMVETGKAKDTVKAQLDVIVAVIHATRREAARTEKELRVAAEAEVESESDVTVEAEENIDAAQTLITEIRMLTAQSIKTSAEVKADITAKLSDATVKLNDARTEFSTKAYAEAKALAEQAAKIGAEAELMLKNTFNARSDDDASVESESSVGTESNVKIEVESNVDVQSENNVGVDL
ncbi:hypothetical protein A3D88_04480 [Candidatus Peribacteria bacterium RIFCSPHIGHO2_02_FULL_52_16]|nr:MAG: hypothetical protein A2706_03110 [Candidatus Peribacteria bacterium RIFCSPHIGHO2_01_FULL_51_35]OGJ60862.1 MAG: hypothetical protein A3D88_04480 [Candidatus Peribacteria bacterium RIFCSPHIGHO2_02_FULL_52_16]